MELTRIERELVLQYLRDDNVPLTVTLEDRPEQKDADLVENRLPSDNERLPASAVFPVAIKSEQISVLNQGIILLKNAARTVEPFLGKKVRVQFYFNHVGLYFITTMKECSQGPAIVVPGSIRRIASAVNTRDYDFSAELSFSDSAGKPVKISCMPARNYSLFAVPAWAEIPESERPSAKALLEKYVLQIKDTSRSAVGNGVHLLSVVRYLTTPEDPEHKAVDSLVQPLEIIYVDDKRIVFAGGEDSAIESDCTYSLEMVFALSANRLIKRTMHLECTLENEYSFEQTGRKCWSCLMREITPEDLRYLYERISGVKVA